VVEDVKRTHDISRNLYAEPEILGVEALREYEVVWRLVADTKPGRQWVVGRQIREVVRKRLDAEGIENPFPRRVMITANGGQEESRAS
jgi:small conductance mechanosensitive channel